MSDADGKQYLMANDCGLLLSRVVIICIRADGPVGKRVLEKETAPQRNSLLVDTCPRQVLLLIIFVLFTFTCNIPFQRNVKILKNPIPGKLLCVLH